MERPVGLNQFAGILAEVIMPKSLFSYVVRYDSAFAPNPFFGYCTLATCKPAIRESAQIDDWIVGTGSADQMVQRGGYLVFTMRVTEVLSMEEYWRDPRFQNKKPNLYGSLVQASGDNIYEPTPDGTWDQLNSYHSNVDGSQNSEHTNRDTGVPKVLISSDFVYFGAEGPKLPAKFLEGGEYQINATGIGYRRWKDLSKIQEFEAWFRSLDQAGFQGKPWDWLKN